MFHSIKSVSNVIERKEKCNSENTRIQVRTQSSENVCDIVHLRNGGAGFDISDGQAASAAATGGGVVVDVGARSAERARIQRGQVTGRSHSGQGGQEPSELTFSQLVAVTR